jgi:hypothetical protein
MELLGFIKSLDEEEGNQKIHSMFKIRVRTIRVTWLSSLGATSFFFFVFVFFWRQTNSGNFWKLFF